MHLFPVGRRGLLLGIASIAAVPALSQSAQADGLRLIVSSDFGRVLRSLRPTVEDGASYPFQVTEFTSWGPDQGGLIRMLSQGERADIILLPLEGLEDLASRGLLLPGSRVDIATSAAATQGGEEESIAGAFGVVHPAADPGSPMRFCAAITSSSKHPEAARMLLQELASPEVASLLKQAGMVTIAGRAMA